MMLDFLSLATSCQKDETNQSYNSSFEVLPRIEYVAPRPPAKPDSPKDIPAMRVTDLSTKESYTLTLTQIEGFTFEEGFRGVTGKLYNKRQDDEKMYIAIQNQMENLFISDGIHSRRWLLRSTKDKFVLKNDPSQWKRISVRRLPESISANINSPEVLDQRS
ncbi:hypothetical protein FQR65_LT17844 [Abscondita terminalis]|nr:hypothetical protein FQR65_LT17844 [Abscondita terminalis]